MQISFQLFAYCGVIGKLQRRSSVESCKCYTSSLSERLRQSVSLEHHSPAHQFAVSKLHMQLGAMCTLDIHASLHSAPLFIETYGKGGAFIIIRASVDAL